MKTLKCVLIGAFIGWSSMLAVTRIEPASVRYNRGLWLGSEEGFQKADDGKWDLMSGGLFGGMAVALVIRVLFVRR